MESEELERLRDAHLSLSATDWALRELASVDTEWLARRSFSALYGLEDLLTFENQQPWPTLIGAEPARELRQASLGLSRLVRSVFARAHGENPERIARFYGVPDPILVELLLEPPNCLDEALSRPDFVLGADGFRCIEFNVGADLGGWEGGFLNAIHLSQPILRQALEQIGAKVSYVDTTQVLFEHLLTVGSRLQRHDPGRLVIVFAAETFLRTRVESLEKLLGPQAQAVAERGGAGFDCEVIVCPVAETRVEGRRVLARNRQVDLLVEVHQLGSGDALFRAFKAEQVFLFNGPLSRLLSDKRNLALISEGVGTWLTPDEAALVERWVPWTRVVCPGSTLADGREVDLAEYARAARQRLVLKSAVLSGGRDVYVGPETSPEVWESMLEKALAEEHWILQEFVRPLPLLYQTGDFGCAAHDVIWSPFVFGPLYAGTILRMQPRCGDSVVNLSRTASEGVVLELIGEGSKTPGG